MTSEYFVYQPLQVRCLDPAIYDFRQDCFTRYGVRKARDSRELVATSC